MKEREIYGGSEVPFVAAEADDGGGMYLNPEFIVEVVDPVTHRPVASGEPGVTRCHRRPTPRPIRCSATSPGTSPRACSMNQVRRAGPRLGWDASWAAPAISRGSKDSLSCPHKSPRPWPRSANSVHSSWSSIAPEPRTPCSCELKNREQRTGRTGLADRVVEALKDGIRLTCDVELVDHGRLGPDPPVVVDRREL